MTWDGAFAMEILPALLRGLLVTVLAVLPGMALALVAGLGLELARRSRRRAVSWPARAGAEFVRGTPLLVQLYFLYFFLLPALGWGTGPFLCGVLGLGLHYATYVAEVYRAGIEAVPRGQWEAARALDLPPATMWRRVILPQAVPPIVPALGNHLVAMFKDTPLLSAITVVEVLRTAQILGAERFRYVEPFTLVGLLYLAVSLLAGSGISRLEERWGVARVRAS